MLHITYVKATFVNGSGAAELLHFRVGAEELRKLEGTQVKRGGEGGWVIEGVGGKNRDSKNETEGMRRRGRGVQGERVTDSGRGRQREK